MGKRPSAGHTIVHIARGIRMTVAEMDRVSSAIRSWLLTGDNFDGREGAYGMYYGDYYYLFSTDENGDFYSIERNVSTKRNNNLAKTLDKIYGTRKQDAGDVYSSDETPSDTQRRGSGVLYGSGRLGDGGADRLGLEGLGPEKRGTTENRTGEPKGGGDTDASPSGGGGIDAPAEGTVAYSDAGEAPQHEDLSDVVTRMAMELSARHKDDRRLLDDALYAIGGSLSQLRKAMSLQREYDKGTAKTVADLAREMFKNGMLTGVTDGEVKRLLSAVKNAVARKDVTVETDKVFDVMVDAQLRRCAGIFSKLLNIKGVKVDATGVPKAGSLDVRGQRLLEGLRSAIATSAEELSNRRQAALDRLDSLAEDDADGRASAEAELSALDYADRYAENVTRLLDEERALKEEVEQAAADYKAGIIPHEALLQLRKEAASTLRQMKIDRADALRQLAFDLASDLKDSKNAAAAFRRAKIARVNQIRHEANSDLAGLPYEEHRRGDSFMQSVKNSTVVQFFTQTLPSFEAILKLFSPHSPGGQGYLYNRFMRGWVDATESERRGINADRKMLDNKCEEIFGKGMTWRSVAEKVRKMPLIDGRKTMKVRFWSGGGMREFELTQPELVYIYMANKMDDGRMKLKRMGITEFEVERMTDLLDRRLVRLADWLQDEFFVETRKKFNKVHLRMFGAPMAAIDNYVPLKILKNAVEKETDIADTNHGEPKSSTTTGSIIRRTRNAKPIDVLHANIFDVVNEHISNMEHWAAFSELSRDLNALLSYKRFRNKVRNMQSVLGSGSLLLRRFETACAIATGNYRPNSSRADRYAVNLARLASTSKVAFRLFTAFKQLASMPAYLTEVTPATFAKSLATPAASFKWALENLPLFEKRWIGRMSGNEKLMPSDMDWSWTQKQLVEKLTRWGLSPNAFVDAVTVAVGAKAMYDTRMKRYLRDGYTEDDAQRLALQDATILYNKTQQSSESAFLSEMQVARSWWSTMMTVFRNSPISYERMVTESVRDLSRMAAKDKRREMKDFLVKQQLRAWGYDTEKEQGEYNGRSYAESLSLAENAAGRTMQHQWLKDVASVAVFGLVMQLVWNGCSQLAYLLLNNDDEEKRKTLTDIGIHSLFGSIEGLTAGDVLSDGFNALISEDGLTAHSFTKEMPLGADVGRIIQMYGYDKAAAANELVNTLAAISTGVDPRTFGDAAVAVWDACGGKCDMVKEVCFCLLRIAQVPQSQLDKIYFDELDCTGAEAKKLTPEQVAQRYAAYKVMRGATLTSWLYNQEEEEKREGSYEQRAIGELKERTEKLCTPEVNKAYEEADETYIDVKKQLTELRAQAEELGPEEIARRATALTGSPEWKVYAKFRGFNKKYAMLVSNYLQAKTPEQANTALDRIAWYKPRMMQAITTTDQAEFSRLADEMSLLPVAPLRP